MEGKFLQIPNKIADILPFLDLTQRQWQAVWLIIRLTYGCQKREAKLKLADFTAVGISSFHIRTVIDPLTKNQIIIWKQKNKEFCLNVDYLIAEFTNSVNLERLRELIGINLRKLSHFSKSNITKPVTQNLPMEKVLTYQASKNNKGGLTSTKDMIKDKFKNSETYIASKKTLNEALPLPNGFKPQMPGEIAAADAWRRLEPNNNLAFTTTYLRAYKQGLPEHVFYQFTSEIQQDGSITNKGAVFNSKVKEYLKRRKNKNQ